VSPLTHTAIGTRRPWESCKEITRPVLIMVNAWINLCNALKH